MTCAGNCDEDTASVARVRFGFRRSAVGPGLFLLPTVPGVSDAGESALLRAIHRHVQQE